MSRPVPGHIEAETNDRREVEGCQLATQYGVIGGSYDDVVTPLDDSHEPTPDQPRLFLLDGHSLAYRAFFALPSTLATTTGQITNAVYGFTSMLIKLLGDEQPDLIAVAFDSGPPTVRLEKDAEYKAGRKETPGDFTPQLGLIEEVLDALKIPVLRVTDGNEADDVLGTLAVRAAERGIEATIVTGDRDFFQLVRPAIKVLFNRRGISDMVLYDEAGVEERFGLPPSKYLDFVALKGDTSDNIPGVPGVGDKTAAKLVNEYGSVEALVDHLEDLKGRLKENVTASVDRLSLNKDLARIVTDVPLAIEPEDCRMGAWDVDEVRHLFGSLEFRSLFDRLLEAGPGAKPKVEIAELDLREATVDELTALLSGGSPVGVRLQVEGTAVRGMAVSAGGAQAAHIALSSLDPVAAFVASPDAPKWMHDAKAFERAVRRAGGAVSGVAFDTMLAGYLLDPASADYPLSALCERYLGSDVLGGVEEEDEGQLFTQAPWRPVAAEAAAVALLAPVMAEQVDAQGLGALLQDVELPLASVLARMEARGVRLDVAYLEEMGTGVRERMATLKATVYEEAGEEFNLNSPPQLRTVLYEKLGLQPGKKTPKGELSTDASVLEKLRDHPVVDALLSWRELDKLNSTYLEALPRLVDPADGRIHTSFNQAVAATGRLSSSNPNLQNIPLRSDIGRQMRRAFVPGEPGQVLLAADYSQIELRILAHLSGDAGLRDRVRERPGHPRRHGRGGVRLAAGPGGRRVAPARQGRELRPRVRDERLGPGAAPGPGPRRGPGDHGRLLRRVPLDQGLPGRPGGEGHRRGVHRDPVGAAPVRAGAAGVQPAGAGPGPPPGAERPDPGQRLRRLQGGDDRGRPGPAGTAGARLPHAADRARRARVRGAGGERGGGRRAGPGADGGRRGPRRSAPGGHRLGTELVRRRPRRALTSH